MITVNTNVASVRSAYTSQTTNAGSKASSRAPGSPFGSGTSVRISQEAFAKSRAGEAYPNPQKRPVGFDDTGNLTRARARAAAAYPNPQKTPVSFDDTGNLTREAGSGSDSGVVGWDVGPVGFDDTGNLTRSVSFDDTGNLT